MTFQLWETESANLVGSWPTQDAPLVIVRKVMEAHGREVAATLVPLREGPRGRLANIAESAALADLALTRGTPAAEPGVAMLAER